MNYYAIKPIFSSVTRYVREGQFDLVYDRILFITSDHETAEDASSWCEYATIGDVYEHDQFTIEVIDDDE